MSALSTKLTGINPLDALALLAIREIKLTVSHAEATRLQKLADDIDCFVDLKVSRVGSDPIAETMADAIHLASARRESLVAAHLLAAIFRRMGTAVGEMGSRHYASPDEMMDRLVPKNR